MQSCNQLPAKYIRFSKLGDFWLLPFSPCSGSIAAVAVKSAAQPKVSFFELSPSVNLIDFSSSWGLKMQTITAFSGYMKEAVRNELEISHG
jgi:hypothetical protein